MKSRFLNKECLTVLINVLDIFYVLGVGLDVFDDFHAEKLDDNLNTFVTNHHFLMVGFDLVSITGSKNLGKVSKDLSSLPLLMRIENAPEIFEISDINIIFFKVPTKKL